MVGDPRIVTGFFSRKSGCDSYMTPPLYKSEIYYYSSYHPINVNP